MQRSARLRVGNCIAITHAATRISGVETAGSTQQGSTVMHQAGKAFTPRKEGAASSGRGATSASESASFEA